MLWLLFCLFKEGAFKLTSVVDQLAVHFVLDGCLIHQDSDEARRLAASEDLSEGVLGVRSDLQHFLFKKNWGQYRPFVCYYNRPLGLTAFQCSSYFKPPDVTINMF